MLSIGAMGNGQGTYYVGLAREDYYLEGGEPPGRWLGEGAARLGLIDAAGTGPDQGDRVEREALLNLFAGCDAHGLPLVQNADAKDRQPGWDLTFSAPKSVSTIWAVADADTRHAIQEAHFAALKEALHYIEEGATTRRGKGGEHKEPAQLLIATFEHGTSRAQDPQLHTHALVLNIGMRPDGTTGTLESQSFYRSKMAAGSLYRAELSHRLQGLGFEIEREKSTFEVKGVPQPLQEEFSKRRAEIEAALEKQGKTSARAAAFAALGTREVKEHRARDELFQEWREVGATHGFTNERVQELKRFAPTRGPQVELAEALQRAIERISRDKSHFGERELLRATAEEAQGRGLSATQIRAGVKAELQKPSFITLGPHEREAHYTTRELWEIEKALLANAEHLRQVTGHQVEHRHYLYGILKAERRAAQIEKTAHKEQTPQQHPERAKDSQANDSRPDASRVGARESSGREAPTPQMSSEQRAALAHITKETGGIALVSGMAGTGKTFLLDAAREAWEAQGFKVIGAAVAGKAARGLEEGAGIKSTTVARLGFEWERGFDSIQVSEKWARKVEWLHATWQIDSKTRRELLAPLEVPKTKLGAEWQYATWQISKSQKEMLEKHIERRERFELDAKTVLVIDEAGMLGTKQMGTLLAKARETGAKVVLVGEQRQIQAVEVGGPFGSLQRRLGASELTQIIRQKEAWQRAAVKDFAEGRAAKALAAYHERGWLTITDGREAAKRALITAWKAEGVKAPRENVIFAGTRDEARSLNRMAQEARRRAGALGFRTVKIGRDTIHEKDRVLFTKNSLTLGVQNGTTGTVKEVDVRRHSLTVKLDNGQESLIPLREYQEIMIGYALTTHKGQGQTVRNAYVLCGGPMADRELSYVQASRAREKTQFFSERQMVWNPATQRREDATLSELARQMSQTRQKDLAHDVAENVAAPARPSAQTGHARQKPELLPAL